MRGVMGKWRERGLERGVERVGGAGSYAEGEAGRGCDTLLGGSKSPL